MFNLESLGAIVIAALATQEHDAAIKLLASLHSYDSDLYGAGIFLANYTIKKGEVAALKTATKLDDQAIAAVAALIKESATSNGITL